MGHKFSLFDSRLLINFSLLSNIENTDLCKVFDKTLVKAERYNAIGKIRSFSAHYLSALTSIHSRLS
jgi:hypothetical protein